MSCNILQTKCLLVSLQRPLVHLLGLVQLALGFVEVAQVVDRVKCLCMIWAPCLLVSLQCLLVHLLGLVQLALGLVEGAQVVDRVKC